MALTEIPLDVKNRLNSADPNDLADLLRAIGLGDYLRSASVQLFKQAPAALGYTDATTVALQLPDDAKCSTISEVYVRAGGVTGKFVIDGVEAAPASGHAGVSPSRDITFLAADAVTSADVTYKPLRSDAVELTLSVTPGTGVVAIPNAWKTASGAALLVNIYEVEILAPAGVAGKCVIDPAGTAVAVSKHAALTVAKSGISMLVADAVTSVRVKAGLIPAIDMNAILESAAVYG